MTKHLKRNHRLRWVFSICKELGIDDPVFWMDNVSPKLVDMWIAYFIADDEMKAEAMRSKKTKPEDLEAQARKIGG